MTEFIVVLVFPLSNGVHELMIDVLAINDEVVVDVEDEIPGTRESLAHGSELVKVSPNCGFALLKLTCNVADDRAKVLYCVKHAVESSMVELVNHTTDPLPDVLGVSQAFDSMRNLGLDCASQQAF